MDSERLSYYHYGVCILDHVLCEENEIVFSDFLRLKKIKDISDPLGVYVLGEDAINSSKALSGREWNAKISEDRNSIFPPFSPDIMDIGGYSLPHYRVREHSDCVLESGYAENDPRIWNSRYQEVRDQIVRAVTSIRLLHHSPIRCLGPITCDTHPAVQHSLPASPTIGVPAIGGSSSYHEQLFGSIQAGMFVEIDKNSAKIVKQLFVALGYKLPPWLQISLERLNMAYSRPATRDQLIDVMIGLEALYLYGLNAELKFRLAMRAAAHQETDSDMRWNKYREVCFLYDARSRIVHGGTAELVSLLRKASSPFGTVEELISSSREILRKGCCKVLLDYKCADGLGKDFQDGLDKIVLCH
jgi:hypothetical protein